MLAVKCQEDMCYETTNRINKIKPINNHLKYMITTTKTSKLDT